MTEGIGRTTLGRVAVNGGRPPDDAREVGEELLEVASGGQGASTEIAVDGDVETRHRLRRALRILLAARRRDNGS